jgi:ribosomal protein S27AE
MSKRSAKSTVLGLPEIIKCAKCGYVLYKGNDLIPPRDVIRKFDGKCPRCSSTLSQNPVSIEVRELKKW